MPPESQLPQFLVDTASGLVSTLLAAAITISAVAEVKCRRLRAEFAALSAYLQRTHETRCKTDDAAPQAETMAAVKAQLEELMTEISSAKEGVLSFSREYRREIKALEKDIGALVNERFINDWIRLLFGDRSKVEQGFRGRINSAEAKARSLGARLHFWTLLLP